jgi:predicted transcriptional regulator
MMVDTDLKRVTLYLPQQLHQRLKTQAEVERRAMSELARVALAEYLKKHEVTR